MKKERTIKKHIRRGRFGKALQVNLRWGWRRFCRFFRREEFVRGVTGSYARRLYAMILVLAVAGGCAFAGAYFADRWTAGERVLTDRLAMESADGSDPVLMALECVGSSNRVQITLRTAKKDNLHPQGVDLDRGNIHLVMTLKNGKVMEYTLQNARIDNFESGSTDHFTLILPQTVSPFDITEYKLLLVPDAKGAYDEWHCLSAQVAFLLGGERTLLARSSWSDLCVFNEGNPSAVLPIATDTNLRFARISEIYPYILEVCAKQKGSVHTKEIKKDANIELGLMNGDTLYLDIETVGLENQNQLLQNQPSEVEIPETDRLNYNGTMTLRVQFLYPFEGSYVKDYALDTPGKDDFEMGNTSTFGLPLPEGASAFDIVGMELLVHDSMDAWAPRMIRAYLRTDYGTALELARLSDVQLIADRKTGVFYRGLIETEISPLALDLTADYALPRAMKETIEKQYFTEIEGVIYSMYFGERNFFDRQKLYYSQVLYGVKEK